VTVIKLSVEGGDVDAEKITTPFSVDFVHYEVSVLFTSLEHISAQQTLSGHFPSWR